MNKYLRKGFTLVELLIVIIIIAVLATVVLVVLNPAAQRARAAATTMKSNVGSICRAQAICMVEKDGSLCDSFAELQIADPSSASQTYTFGGSSPWAVTGTTTQSSVDFTFVCNNVDANKGKVACTDSGATTEVSCATFNL